MLTENCLIRIFESNEVPIKPILQIVKIVNNKKLVVSDGNSSVIVLLLTANLYDIVERKIIKEYDIIEVLHYVIDKKRKRLIITQLKKLNEYENIIGDPLEMSMYKDEMKNTDLMRNSNPFFRKISQIQVFMIKDWYITGKVIKKYPLKSFKDKNNTSKKFFSFIIRDSDENTAKVICFDESLVNILYNDIKINWIYKITNLQPKEANTKYNSTTCKYDLLITKNTTYESIYDDESFESNQMNFTLIKDVSESKLRMNILSYILSSEDIKEVTTSKGRYIKRTLVICDDSGYCIDLTLWGDYASTYQKDVNRIIKATDIQLSKYRCKSLTTTYNSDIEFDPRGLRSEELINYFNSNDNIKKLIYISEQEKIELFNHIAEASKEGVYEIVCYLVDIPLEKLPIYFACPNIECKNKGLISNNDEKYFCERCSSVIDCPLIRYNARIKISDFTGALYTTFIGDDNIGEVLFGMNACDFFKRMTSISENEYKSTINSLLFKEFKIKLRTRKEVFNGQEAMKTVAISVMPIDYGKEVEIIYKRLMIS